MAAEQQDQHCVVVLDGREWRIRAIGPYTVTVARGYTMLNVSNAFLRRGDQHEGLWHWAC